jgi:hypothetical protein
MSVYQKKNGSLAKSTDGEILPLFKPLNKFFKKPM